MPAHCSKSRTNRLAFTLAELLVTIAIISILLSLVIPVVSKGKGKAHETHCINNLKQLQVAWIIYSDDNAGSMPINTSENIGGVWRSTTNSWVGASSAPTDMSDDNIKKGVFYSQGYVKNTGVFHCPADKSFVSDINGKIFREKKRTRSYSLNSSFSGREKETRILVKKLQSPKVRTNTFVFLDEKDQSIDDGHFLVWPIGVKKWVNMPSDRHSVGCVLSFVDGHVEKWTWLHNKNFNKKTAYWKNVENLNDEKDLIRLQNHTIQ